MKHIFVVLFIFFIIITANQFAVQAEMNNEHIMNPDIEEDTVLQITISPSAIPSPEPTIDPALIPPMRSVGEVPVWHTTNGKWYHVRRECGSMSNASQYTLASSLRAGLTACPYCNPISPDVMNTKNAVYVSRDHRWHINFDCESIVGDWTLSTLDEARADRTMRPCDACGAVYYAETTPLYNAASMPGETAGSLSALANGSELVYTSEHNAYYHRTSACPTAPGIQLAPIHLSEALLSGKTRCPQCSPPEPELGEAP